MFLIHHRNLMVCSFRADLLQLLINASFLLSGQYLSVEELATIVGATDEGMKAVTQFFTAMGNTDLITN